jgi:hypothetical protein
MTYVGMHNRSESGHGARITLWDFKFSWRRVQSSELSFGMYCHVKWLSTYVSEVRAASIIRDEWWRQHVPLKRRSTIILHGSTSQKTILNKNHLVHPHHSYSWHDLCLTTYILNFLQWQTFNKIKRKICSKSVKCGIKHYSHCKSRLLSAIIAH